MTDATTTDHDTLWITDAELIRRLGVPEKIMRAALRAYDQQRTGFPQKSQLLGGRRYWPAVVAFYDRQNGLSIEHPQPRRVANAR